MTSRQFSLVGTSNIVRDRPASIQELLLSLELLKVFIENGMIEKKGKKRKRNMKPINISIGESIRKEMNRLKNNRNRNLVIRIWKSALMMRNG